MPHFCGACNTLKGLSSDTWICQKCGEVFCSNPKCSKYRKSIWVEDLIVFKNRLGEDQNQGGNVCVECFSDGTQKSY